MPEKLIFLAESFGGNTTYPTYMSTRAHCILDFSLLNMLGEDLTSKEALQDLITRECDAPIFQRLQMTYGQAVRFKNELSKLLPYQYHNKGKTPPTKVKPSMDEMCGFSPEQKRAYLTK